MACKRSPGRTPAALPSSVTHVIETRPDEVLVWNGIV